MQPMTTLSSVSSAFPTTAALANLLAAINAADEHVTAHQCFAKGQTIFTTQKHPGQKHPGQKHPEQNCGKQNYAGQSYLVLSGEVVIMRNGRPVDLIEAGEWLESALWVGSSAVALTDCTVEAQSESVQRFQH
ncbi:MAG: hypothetical protein R3C14_52025 [Caldilineaceae bacterium]